MTALTDIGGTGPGSAGGEVWIPHEDRATEYRPTGSDLLVWSAAVLPVVVGGGPVRCADVHTALYESAVVRGAGRDRPHRLRLADEAFDMLAAYLVASGRTCGCQRSSDTVWEWLIRPGRRNYRRLAEVQLALAAAAGYWQWELELAKNRRDGGPIMVR